MTGPRHGEGLIVFVGIVMEYQPSSIADMFAFLRTNGCQTSSGQRLYPVRYTPEMAEQALMLMYERQRNIRISVLKTLVAAMQRGEFLNNNVIWFSNLPNGSIVGINGQHTLEAIVQSGVEQTLITVLAPVASEMEMQREYAVFDVGAVRTQADINRARFLQMDFNSGIPNAKPFPATEWHWTRGTNAATWLLTGMTSGSAGVDIKQQRLNMIQDENKWLPEFVKFWQLVGPLENDLAGAQRITWKTFYVGENGHGGITGATLMPSFLVYLRASPPEAETLIQTLVGLAKKGYTPATRSTDGADLLYNWILSPDPEHWKKYGTSRHDVVRRGAAYVAGAWDGNAEDLYQADISTWGLLTSGRLEDPQMYRNPVRVNVSAAKRRRVKKGRPETKV